jgi:alcohol dehydrogenase class IV
VDEAREVAEQTQPFAYVAIGGGSAIGLAKGLAIEDGRPIIAVPTTFAGSEQTNIFGISTEDGKTTGRDDRALPQVVVYDPNLTATMPKGLAVTSAMNAMAHLMEALYSPSGNPVTRSLAMQGMKTLKAGLETMAESDRLTQEANEQIQFGAYLAGKCLCEVDMALHHKTAHVLGGSFGMDHSKVHTVLQPYVLAYQWPYLDKAIQEDFKEALASENPAQVLKDLAANASAPTTLEAIGFQEADIEKAAFIMAANPYANIAPLSKEGLAGMLRNAYDGIIKS